ncbi:hypothetical protein LAZ67_17001174 [Cordylochernes scorpioides]|uniref:Uncharacterized protein n=1 Tax=Cordylochernes scorpioides TaxID=51811 RepID=A0ABY6LGX1_9ARAC|nr:hypothetical protein LAZ67_17001174 [Cordylochernes scorpioides]
MGAEYNNVDKTMESNFVASLRRDIADCEFKAQCECGKDVSASEIFLRAQFIRGIKDNWIKEQILQSEIYAFNDILTKAIALEASKTDCHELSKARPSTTTINVTDEVHKVSRHNYRSRKDNYKTPSQNRPRSNQTCENQHARSKSRGRIDYEKLGINNVCLRCGRNNHLSKNCRTDPSKLTCTSCHKTGHVSKICIRTLLSNKSNNTQTNHIDNYEDFGINRIVDMYDQPLLNASQDTTKYYVSIKIEVEVQVEFKDRTSIEELFIIPNNYDPLLGRTRIRHLKLNLEEIDQENINQIKELKVSSINDDYDIEKEFPEIYTQKVGCVPDFLITLQLRQGLHLKGMYLMPSGRRWKRNWTHWKQKPNAKQHLSNSRMKLRVTEFLIPFDINLPVTLTTDASPVGIAAVLSHGINKVEYPIAFASRSLTDAEQNYSQLDREALAIVVFGKGTDNQIADCLSRAPTAQGYVTTDMIINEEVHRICSSTVFEISTKTLTVEEIVKETDKELSKLKRDIKSNSIERPFQGYYYLVLIDAKSRWAEIKAISEPPTSLNIIKLLNDIVSTHGYPFVMVSDNASIFTGDTFSNYCLENGIRQKFIAPGHPATNRLAERNVQTLKNKLKSMINENVPIHQKIQKMLLRYRATPLASGRSPSEMYLNRQIRIKLDAMRPYQEERSQQQIQPRTRCLQVGERVQARVFISNKPFWKNGTIKQKLGNLHYIIELDEASRPFSCLCLGHTQSLHPLLTSTQQLYCRIMSSQKRKRESITIEKKKEICQLVRNNPTMSKNEIGKRFSLPRTTVRDILTQAEKWENYTVGSSKRQRVRKFSDLEDVLFNWFTQKRANNIIITDDLLREKRFKGRFHISQQRLCGEGASISPAIIDEHLTNLNSILANSGYDSANIYNADETGLFFQLIPDRTLAHKDENCRGVKRMKQRITVLLYCNSTGTDKRRLLIIGKSAKPRCFRNFSPHFYCTYTSNSKAWMTSSIFQECLLQFNKQLVSEDTLSSNKYDCQSLDSGIIKSFKAQNRKLQLQKMVELADAHLPTELRLDDAVRYCKKAWDSVGQLLESHRHSLHFYCCSEPLNYGNLLDRDIFAITPESLMTEREFQLVDDSQEAEMKLTDDNLLVSTVTAKEELGEDDDTTVTQRLPSLREARTAAETVLLFLEHSKRATSDDVNLSADLLRPCLCHK